MDIFYKSKRYILFFLVNIFILFVSSNNLRADGDNMYKIKKVVIDPGHGGKDPGAVGKKSYEKDIILSISLKLGDLIEKNFNDVQVIYTRKEDVFVELFKRAEIANTNNADLFISVHANASKNSKSCGTETYVMGLHKTNENLEVAKRENAVILIEEDYLTKYEGYDPNSAESFIVFSLLQNAYLEQSLNLADKVQEQFRERVKRKDRGVMQAGFLVLWKTTMPSILVETGFISNAKEEQFLLSDIGQDYIASAIFRAFRSYKNIIESKSNFMIFEEQTDSLNSRFTPDSITTDEIKVGISFKIQIASSNKSIPLDSKEFKGLKDIEEFEYEGTYKYTVGDKTNYNEIVKLQKKIRKNYPDAFIVAFDNGKKISVKEAIHQTSKSKN